MSPDDAIAAGRRIAGLIGHSPGPGIYSRMQRAVEAMPEMVRAEELPGLIRRHKEGVPGWELKAVDLPSLYEGRSAVPREELLQAVKERSPLYTHGEVVLADVGPVADGIPEYQESASTIGQGVMHGDPKYKDFGQGGENYTEILLTQPGARNFDYGNHWTDAATNSTYANRDAVAHARFDRHGDALRINELQSDLGIRNRQLREQQAKISAAIGESDFIGYSSPDPSKPFPLEDAWLDLLIKRLALEAARGGYRAIEIASPRSIADKVGGNIDNYEHLYGKVVPGALERLGRKTGGLVDDTPTYVSHTPYLRQVQAEYAELQAESRSRIPPDVYQSYRSLVLSLADNEFPETIMDKASHLASRLESTGRQSGNLMPGIMSMAEREAKAMNAADAVQSYVGGVQESPTVSRRYLMSDEMRRNILRNGIPASVLGAAALSEER